MKKRILLLPCLVIISFAHANGLNEKEVDVQSELRRLRAKDDLNTPEVALLAGLELKMADRELNSVLGVCTSLDS